MYSTLHIAAAPKHLWLMLFSRVEIANYDKTNTYKRSDIKQPLTIRCYPWSKRIHVEDL